jgi:hypothetical protein
MSSVTRVPDRTIASSPVARTILGWLGYAFLSPAFLLLHSIGFCSGPLALRGLERLRWQMGLMGAWVRFQNAARTVPAYATFLDRSGTHAASSLTLSGVPPTDKQCYVNVFPLEARCTGGRFPTSGVMIDESSGSSGMPTNWIRGAAERDANRRTIRYGLRHASATDRSFFSTHSPSDRGPRESTLRCRWRSGHSSRPSAPTPRKSRTLSSNSVRAITT